MEIGKPIKRHTVIPLKSPVQAPEPVAPPLPARTPKEPARMPEKVDG